MSSGRADLARYLDELRRGVDEALARILAQPSAPSLVAKAMQYSALGPGKRLRPCLTLATADAVADRIGLDSREARRRAMPGACAVELIHAYSLVHDDLPAMDDDAWRRGRPTTHVVYGDGLAILAGDGLLTEAFSVLAGDEPTDHGDDRTRVADDRRLRAVARLAAAAGAAGMVGGQAIDLAAAGRVIDTQLALDRAALEDMHARKTGALIRAAGAIGAILAGADDPTIAAIDEYARALGLAFQIVDDLLDVEGSKEQLGKTAGKDVAAGKPTYPAFFGIEASRSLAAACVERAKASLVRAGVGGRLSEIADWSLVRRI